MGMGDVSPEAFTVRLLAPDGRPAGIGVLVSGRHILTCAHVVNAALGRDLTAEDRPDAIVRVDFPFLFYEEDEPLSARVVHWVPPPTADRAGDDIAGLEFAEGGLPWRAVPARFAVERPRPPRVVRLYGCPAGRPDGEWVDATIRERVASGRFQLDSGAAHKIRKGFSGSPVFDAETGLVVGLVAMASPRSQDPDSYAISADQLRLTWPEVLDRRGPRPSQRREVVILHLSGTRCDANGELAESLKHLPDDVTRLAEQSGVRPDLLVVTGDLTEHGRRGEFESAFGFIGALAEAAGVPRRQVAIVPGSRDFNHTLSRNYFAEQEEEGAEPLAPYFPKWKWFAEAMTEFYGDADVFTPDEPWTLFEMPELSLVVAGMNSTMAESHLTHYGWVGDDQLRWFGRRLRESRDRKMLRLVAMHHHALRDARSFRTSIAEQGAANLLLLGGGSGPHSSGVLALPAGDASDRDRPGRYQLITVRRDAYARHAREYATDQRRWMEYADVTRVRHDLAHVEATFTEAGKERRADYPSRDAPVAFFDLVVEAARARAPKSVITSRREEGYFRVSLWLPGGGIEPYPVGVAQVLDAEAVDAFIGGVHAEFRAASAQVPSELVYGGPPAPPHLIARARKNGVTLRSFTEYQGLLDLRPLVGRQHERLDADRQYPAELYIDQRYRVTDRANRDEDVVLTGLVEHAVEWLGTSGPRLVMVLGDFGRGKTAFLKQLTRTFPAELPGVLPILVEMRGLEKAPTLDQLLLRYLAEHVDDISLGKLGYMIRSGRIALLFDGFDELELRVGYDSAADYLRTLLESVTDRAKVVITSRTQHFMSTEQVRTALGERVEALGTSRIAILEDFTEEQIADFLAGRYGGDTARAQTRLELLKTTGNLLDLARNPRMLTFVAALDEDRLRTVSSGADLYREIIDFWLGEETKRQAHPRGLRSLQSDERFKACTALALRMWTSGEPTIGLGDLSAEVSATLTELTERGYSEAFAAHAIGSGSLLVRAEDGTFRFIHQSIMEWLVAAAIADELNATGTAQILGTGTMSGLMARFFMDLADAEHVDELLRSTLGQFQIPGIFEQNIWRLTAIRPGAEDRVIMAGADLRAHDLNGRDLHGANLYGANLRGMQLHNVDLSGADLSEADFSGVRMTGGSLRGATLTGSNWDRAALLGTDILGEPAPELARAAVPGRDPIETIVRPPYQPQCVAYSPDGTLLAVGSGNVTEIVDAIDGTILRILRGHHGRVRGVAFSPDGTHLATASHDRTARIWDTTTGATLTTLTGHDNWVTAVAFSPDGTHLATASADRTAQIWDTTTGATLTTLTGHDNWVTAVAFSPDGTHLATASHDRTAQIWDTTTGATLTTLTGHGSWVTGVAFFPDGTRIATTSRDSTTRIWDSTTGATLTTLTGHGSWVTGVAFFPDGTRIATTSRDCTTRIWDTTTGADLSILTGHGNWVEAVAFSPDGSRIATTSRDGTARIWDTTTGATLTTLAGHRDWVRAIAFSLDATRLATASDPSTARIWDTTTGELLATLSGHDGWVTAVAYSPDGTRLATASHDRTARIWDTTTYTALAVLAGHDGSVTAIAFSDDGTRLATASDDGTTRIWDTTGATLAVLAGHASTATSVAFSFGDTRVTTFTGRTTQIWDTTTGTAMTTISDHDNTVTSAAISSDGTRRATASDDGTARVWDATTGTMIATLIALEDDGYATLYPDGSYKLSGDPGDRLWWAIKLCRFTPGELDPYVPDIRRR
jgi:WD40 repeat protein